MAGWDVLVKSVGSGLLSINLFFIIIILQRSVLASDGLQ